MAEEWMSKLYCRCLIVGVAVLIASLSSRSADAQYMAPDPTARFAGFLPGAFTGIQYDIINEAKAERRLQQVQSSLRRNSERGNTVAADRNLRRIGSLKYRIAVDEWLIRKNSLVDPGYYPTRIDSISCEAINQVAQPPSTFSPSQSMTTP